VLPPWFSLPGIPKWSCELALALNPLLPNFSSIIMHNYPALIICSGTELDVVSKTKKTSKVVRVKMGSSNIGWLGEIGSVAEKLPIRLFLHFTPLTETKIPLLSPFHFFTSRS
jgi:hypothetical protein